jgi:uncharacterized membrane protein YphA (DoxX/SURF4 family)
MNSTVKKYSLLGLKILAALAFLAAGLAKLTGAEMMVATFEAVGVGQWFRYVTGVIEVLGAIALFVPAVRVYCAALLAVTMIGAILAHLLILGPSAVPALVLLIITGTIAFAHRDELNI